nr:hypothetical protein [Gemmatimonadota bacterium]
ALWGAAGRQIGRMHAGGIAHPDLNLHNLLVVDAARAGCEVYLLDFDRARLFRGTVPGSRRGSDLRRLARSARKLGVPLEAGSVAALRAGYGGGWPESAGTLG